MGIKRFFKNKIKDYQFIKNRKKVSSVFLNLDFFKNHTFNFSVKTNSNVSVIIYGSDDLKMILNCLYHVEKYDQQISKEVSIVLHSKNNQTKEYLNHIETVTVIECKEKYDDLNRINHMISEAKSEFVYLLNANSLVLENYLTESINIFKTKEDVGAIGSKLISPENTIVEAGNLVINSNEILKLGQSRSIETPDFNFLRKVDFCSQSLLFKKINLNGKLNVLNESFSNIDFAVADFCLKLKNEHNLNTCFNPFSEVIYFVNQADSENNNNKNFLKKLIDENSSIINRNYKKPSFLFLEENMPKPDQDSGSRRFMEIVKILQKNNHRIVLAVKHFDETKDSDYISYFQNAGVQICTDYVSAQNKIVKVTDQVVESLSYIDLIWIFRPIGFDYWYNLLKDKTDRKKIIYDMVDLHYLRMERENNYIDNISKEREKEINFFREKEYLGMNTADAVISISEEEKNTVSQNGVKKNKIFTVSNIHKPIENTPLSFSERDGLLFIGGYNHLPNIDAVKFLHEQIMPLVWTENAEVKIFILGPDFPSDLKEKYHSEKFQILGYQETVDFWFENSRVFVAPLRYGAGVKGKIGQALEFRLPVITTGIGAEGMSLEDRKTALISDENPQNFADKILELYDNKNLWNILHENSLLPLSKFSIETQEENIKKMLNYLGFED